VHPTSDNYIPFEFNAADNRRAVTGPEPDLYATLSAETAAYVKMAERAAGLIPVTRMTDDDERRLLEAARYEDGAADKRRFIRYMVEREGRNVTSVSARNHRQSIARGLVRYRTGRGVFRHPGEYTAFFFLVLETACAPREALQLEWDDIDLASGTVYFRIPSSDICRPVAVSDFLCRGLADLPRLQAKIFSFDMPQVRRAWRRISERADVGFINLANLQAEGAWRKVELARTSALLLTETRRRRSRLEEVGHGAIPDMASLKAEVEDLLQEQLYAFRHERSAMGAAALLDGAGAHRSDRFPVGDGAWSSPDKPSLYDWLASQTAHRTVPLLSTYGP
jgi:integrase